MTEQDHLRHLEILKADSQKLKKMIKSQNYNPKDVDAILESTEKFRFPQPATEDKTKSRRSSFLLKHNVIQSYLHDNKKHRRQNHGDGSLNKQIIDLRNQNTHLQKMNAKFQAEIQTLNQDIAQLKLQKNKRKNKSIPYFSFHQLVNANTLNNPISYQKVPDLQYEEVTLILQESKLILELGSTRKELDLKSITNVEYHDETQTVILRIKSEKVWIYLNFSEVKKSYQKFDRCLYINWKIVTSLEGSNMFKNQFLRQKKQMSIRFSHPISERDEEYQRSEYDHEQQTPHNDHQRNQHINHHMNHHNSHHTDHNTDHHTDHYIYKEASRQDSEDSKNQQQNSINFIKNSPQKFKQNSAIYIQEDSIKNLQIQKPQNTNKQASQSLLNLQAALYSEDKDIKTDKNIFFDPYAIPEENSESPSDIDKRIMNNLKKGYKMVKHAKKGYKSHEKYITILDNKTGLQFKDVDSNSSKSIDFKDVIDVKKQIGQGIKKHTKNIDIEQCLVIKLKGGNVIELTSTNVSQIDSLIQELNYVLKEAKFKIN